jgi:hypothetical protein
MKTQKNMEEDSTDSEAGDDIEISKWNTPLIIWVMFSQTQLVRVGLEGACLVLLIIPVNNTYFLVY